jgi:hypothetical protein
MKELVLLAGEKGGQPNQSHDGEDNINAHKESFSIACSPW